MPILRPGLSGREVVEDAKTEVLAVIRRRMMQLREVGAFDGLREPTLKALSEGGNSCFVHRMHGIDHILCFSSSSSAYGSGETQDAAATESVTCRYPSQNAKCCNCH